MLPDDLPAPEDDGAADHLPGARIPALVLSSSQGPVDLAELSAERCVLYVYPRSGRPGVPSLPGWDAFPGARGCTPQSCAFRDHSSELARARGSRSRAFGADARGPDRVRRAQPHAVPGDRRPRAARRPEPRPADVPDRRSHARTAASRSSRSSAGVTKVFYPVFPPDQNAADVVAYLRATVDRWTSTSSPRCSPASPRTATRQVWDWAARGATSYAEMTNVATRTRTLLEERVPFSTLEPQHEARLARRNGQGAVPHARWPPGRGGADALPRRTPLGLRLLAVGLPADLHVLRDGADAVPPQPDRLGDPRPGAALPTDRADRPRRLHGHGRADAEPRRGARRGAAPARRRRHAPAHDDLDGRLAARPDALRRRGRGADPARALAPRAERRAAQRDHAGQRPLPARGRARRVPPLLRAAPAARSSSST